MGLLSGGNKSSSKTINYNEIITDNSNLGASSENGEAIAIRGDNNVTTVTDHNAISAALAFANNAVDRNAEVVDGNSQLARYAIDQTTNTVGNLFARATDAIANLASGAVAGTQQIVSNNAEGEGGRMADVAKWGMLTLLGLGVVYAVSVRGGK